MIDVLPDCKDRFLEGREAGIGRKFFLRKMLGLKVYHDPRGSGLRPSCRQEVHAVPVRITRRDFPSRHQCDAALRTSERLSGKGSDPSSDRL